MPLERKFHFYLFIFVAYANRYLNFECSRKKAHIFNVIKERINCLLLVDEISFGVSFFHANRYISKLPKTMSSSNATKKSLLLIKMLGKKNK